MIKPRRIDLGMAGAQAAVIAGLVAAFLITLSKHGFFGYGDAPSHTLIARRVWDHHDASLAQLGTHWGPLYHALQLPLAWLYPLYASGAAAITVSVLATIVTAAYLYKLALLVSDDKVRAFVAAGMLAVSPSFLYFGVIPMLSATVMAATTANVYYLTRWAQDARGTSLLAAGLTLTLATLAHFDTWVLAPLELVVVIFFARRHWHERDRAEAATLLWLVAGGYGFALFVLMNIAIYGDPFAFLSGYSEVDGTKVYAIGVRAGSSGISRLGDYPQAAWAMAGPALAVAALVGLAWGLFRWVRDPWKLVPLLLLYPLAWYSAQAITSGSYIHPGPTLSTWSNLRYAVTILPGLAYLAAVGLPRRVGAIAGLAAVTVGGVLMLSNAQVAGWEDSLHDVPGERATLEPAANFLHAHAGDNELVMMAVQDPRVDRFELRAQLDLDRFVDATDTKQYKELRAHPERIRAAGVGWIVWIGDVGPDFVGNIVRRAGATQCYWARSPGPGLPNVRIYSLDPRQCT
jgi:hypothetical protein